MNTIKFGTVAVAVAIGAALHGASWAEAPKDVYTETVELTFPFDADGVFSLSNKNGSLEVTTWDKDEVKIVAEKRMRMDNDGVAWLWRIVGLKTEQVETDEDARKVFAELVVESQGDETRREIVTRYPESSNGIRAEVNYRVTLPRNGTVRAELTNGGIHVEDVAGMVDVQSTNGTVDIQRVTGDTHARSTNGRVRIEDSGGNVVARTTNGSVTVELAEGSVGDIELRSVNGSVTLRAPDDAQFALEIRTVHGSASSELPLSSVDEQTRKVLRGHVGEGGGSVNLRTTNGSARVRRG